MIPSTIRTIYLDTMLWNALCDQAVDATLLVARLRERNGCLAIGTHDFYEMAKNFTRPENHGRGRLLFSDFTRYLVDDTVLVKDNMELLAHEMWALKLRLSSPETTLSGEDRLLIVRKAEQFANGELGDDDAKYLERQKFFASSTRTSQIGLLNSRPEVKSRLKSIPADKLTQWLDGEVRRPSGIALLTSHICKRFPEASFNEAAEYAAALLDAEMRFSRAMVRCDLYYNWRCANRGSVPKDLIDDMYHVLNAVYCDVYATGEAKQGEYAHLVLSDETQVAIYDEKTPIDEWLVENLANPRSIPATA
jgi:hypothetical protein